MTEPAALSATYSDFKLIKTRSVISLSFEVPIEHADIVHQVLGIPVPGKEIGVGIARLKADIVKAITEKPSKPKGEHGDYAAKLYKSGFFRNEAVCLALGSDDDFLAWIRTQPSCIDDDDYNIQACHVRRVSGGAGTGIKPPYSAVPMTADQHRIQSVNGEAECLNKFKPRAKTEEEWSVEDAKEWFWKQRCHYLQEWGKERLKAHFKASSLADIDPQLIKNWAYQAELTKYLPKSDLTE